MTPRVTAIVLHWQSRTDTLACLACLRAQDYPATSVSVVDNADDLTLPAAAGVALHRPGRNLGYSGGNNLAIRAALADGADYVWLLNSDATAAPDTLARLVAAAEADPRIGLASPLIARDGGGCEFSGYEFAGALLDMAAGSYRATEDAAEGADWQARHPDRFVLTGTALLLRRALIERIGLLDERFFAYWEDIDYAWRCLRAGFATRMVGEAAVRHATKPAAALDRPQYRYLMARNELLFWRKHRPGLAAARPVLWTLRRELRRAAAQRRTPTGEAILAGLWHGLRGRGGAPDAAWLPAG